MKKFLKNLLLFFFVIIVIAAIGGGIYLYSPEVKPGEVGLLYKIVGKNKGFTGTILTPGKYYCFITEFNPFTNKIYKFKIYSKKISNTNTFAPGVKISYTGVYIIDKKRVNDFFERMDSKNSDKIVKIYIDSAIKPYLIKNKLEDIFAKDFNLKLSSQIIKQVNNELNFFGVKLTKLLIQDFKPTKELTELYKKIKENEKQLAELQIEIEKKLKETAYRNKVKEQELNYLLKKAETEKTITKLKTESMKLLREEAKKRMLEEVEIFSKKGGDLAAKLEAIRILSKSLKNPERVLDKVNKVFQQQ